MPSRPGLSPDVIAPRPPAAAAAGTVPRDVSFARLVEEIDKLGAKTAATVALLLPGLDKKNDKNNSTRRFTFVVVKDQPSGARLSSATGF